MNSPICRRCHNEIETASHILCDSEALADLIFHQFGKYFMKPNYYYEVRDYWHIEEHGDVQTVEKGAHLAQIHSFGYLMTPF
jgi:hypothetical protein